MQGFPLFPPFVIQVMFYSTYYALSYGVHGHYILHIMSLNVPVYRN